MFQGSHEQDCMTVVCLLQERRIKSFWSRRSTQLWMHLAEMVGDILTKIY